MSIEWNEYFRQNFRPFQSHGSSGWTQGAKLTHIIREGDPIFKEDKFTGSEPALIFSPLLKVGQNYNQVGIKRKD